MLYKLEAILVSVFMLPHMHYDLKKNQDWGEMKERLCPGILLTAALSSVDLCFPGAHISIPHLDLYLSPATDTIVWCPSGLTAGQVGTNILSKAFFICLHVLHFMVALSLSPWEWSTAGRCWQHWNEEESNMRFQMSAVGSEYKGRREVYLWVNS